MENYGESYYIEQQALHKGLGLEYNVEYHKLQDSINVRTYKERYETVEAIEAIKSKTKYIFLTINPNTERLTLKDFIIGMNKMMLKPWIQNALYVYEQRGETLEDMGKGYHFHAIIEKPHKKSYNHMVRELSSSGNRYCDTSNFHFFNIKNISQEEKERKVEYITGRKADVAKHLKQDMDIIWRLKVNLLSHYKIGII